MDNELGTRIRALRKERGLSQEALAQALEVSRQAVTKWEDGSSLPSTANLFALSGFFRRSARRTDRYAGGCCSPPSTAAISEKTCAKRVKSCASARGRCWPSAYRFCLYALCSILLRDRLFQRIFRLLAALIWRQISTSQAGSLRTFFGCTVALCCRVQRADRIGNQEVERKTHDR